MAKYTLTRNQAFPDHAGIAGDVIEVENPGDEAWKDLIDGKILVPVKDEAKADKPAKGSAQSSAAQATGDTPSA